jgi:hypothetical protein
MKSIVESETSARRLALLLAIALVACAAGRGASAQQWSGYGSDPQHSADSDVAAQSLQTIHWSTTIDALYGGEFAHYGSPMSTADNTIVVPERNGAGGWQVQGINGANGSVLWTQASDYLAPSSAWLPAYQPTLAGSGSSAQLYYQGLGGQVYERGSLDTPGAVTPTTIQFPGYNGNFNGNVTITTPLTADKSGNVYFGYQVANPGSVGGLQSGIARIDGATHGVTLDQAGAPQAQSAPALSNDGSQVYFAMANGHLTSFNSTTLAPVNTVAVPGGFANLSTASPTVGPDGNVYMGNTNPFVFDRGTLYQYSANLTQTSAQTANPGGFGWDTTTSIVPLSMVPWYHSSSPLTTYLLFTKYNGYASEGGGTNYVALLDPNVTQHDSLAGRDSMLVVAHAASPLPGDAEWCINSGVVDPKTDSIYVNSEDGHVYRWSLATSGGALTQSVMLTSGQGQPYTATLIGADGTVYATEAGRLFAIGGIQGVPEPGTFALAAIGCTALGMLSWRRRMRRSVNGRAL